MPPDSSVEISIRSLYEEQKITKVIDVFRTLPQYQDRKQPQGLHLVLEANLGVLHDHEYLYLQHRLFN